MLHSTRPLLLAAAALALLLPGSVRGENPMLIGTVGRADNPNAFSISLTDASGKPVTHLDPGTYTVLVRDFATIHDFHLSGPGVEEATDVEGTGEVTWTVKLKNGKYHYQCDPHFSTLKGDFTVGTVPTTAKPTTKPKKPKPKKKPKPRYGYSY